MKVADASKNVGARVARYRDGRPDAYGVITGIWSKRGFVYVHFDGRRNPIAVDALLLEFEPIHQPEGTNA